MRNRIHQTTYPALAPADAPGRPVATGAGARGRSVKGFSLIELLVVISIIALVVGITVPFINAMQSGSRAEAGLNTIGVASDVTRQWVGPSRWATDFSSAGAGSASYSGTAAIFTPTRQVRITVNERSAAGPGGGNAGQAGQLELLVPQLNGYKDKFGLDYISIPRGTGLAGIYRNGANFTLIAPPFALVYDENGHLSYGDASSLIYYDGDNDGSYETADTRPAGYNFLDWYDADRNDATKFDPALGTFLLPFDAIECVAGIIAYDLDEAELEGIDFSGGGSYAEGSTEADWLRANGTTVFFSPHTGVMLRDEGQE